LAFVKRTIKKKVRKITQPTDSATYLILSKTEKPLQSRRSTAFTNCKPQQLWLVAL